MRGEWPYPYGHSRMSLVHAPPAVGLLERRPPAVPIVPRPTALRLLESGRVRRVAGGALAASLALHLATAGAAGVPSPDGAAPTADGPISVRYLLPPDRVRTSVGERVAWVPTASGTGAEPSVRQPAPGGAAPGGARAPRAAPVEPRPTPVEGEDAATRIYTAETADTAVARDPESDGPAYPEALRAQGVEGLALVQFVVDSSGRVDLGSFHVVRATDPRFAVAVRDALPRMRFRPAVARGLRVPQLVQLPMHFRLQPPQSGS